MLTRRMLMTEVYIAQVYKREDFANEYVGARTFETIEEVSAWLEDMKVQQETDAEKREFYVEVSVLGRTCLLTKISSHSIK